MFDIPCDIDIYGLVKDFIVPRIPQGFCVRLDTLRLRQAQQKYRKRKHNKRWKTPSKLLYLARPKNVTFKPIPMTSSSSTTSASGSTASSEDTQEKLVVVVVEETPHEGVNGNTATDLAKLLEKTRITEDFLDMDEPREFFPTAQFEKVLKIKPACSPETTSHRGSLEDKVVVDTLDLKKRRTSETSSKGSGDKTAKAVSRNDSKGSLTSDKSTQSKRSIRSTASRGEENEGSRRSSEQSAGKEAGTHKEEETKTYMFSKLIEVSEKLFKHMLNIFQSQNIYYRSGTSDK